MRSIGAAFLLAATAAALAAPNPAGAAVGYELNATTPSRTLNGFFPHGIAVDQASRRIYVAIATKNATSGTPGEIDRFESDLSAAGTFTAGGNSFYTGVAVNPVTHGFYAAQAVIHSPGGNLGVGKMDLFSSTGTLGTQFSLSDTATLPQIATDSNGDVYYPNAATHSVQVFNSAGALQEEIKCTLCQGGAFGKPVSVALDSDDNLYVADLSPDRVVELTLSGGTYAFDSLLQSGKGAAAVGVDPSTDDVLVGDLPSGKNYHIVAYDSSGTQFDDFGAGLFADPSPQFGATVAAQIAADATSHRLYVSEEGKFYLFDRVTIAPPTATIKPASKVGQLSATLNAMVDANGHAALDCDFEYTDHADFEANGFDNATERPCSKLPNGTANTAIEAKLTGLSLTTLYHYRLTTQTNAGSVTTGEQTFETLPSTAATVTSESPTGVAQNGATLQGKVNPHGGTVSDCHFEYGTSVSYGTSLPCGTLPEAVTTDVAVSRAAAGLATGTAYHYRLVVTTNAGTVKGGDVAFATTSPPPPPPPPPPSSGGGDPAPVALPPLVVAPPQTTSPPKPLRCKKGFRKKRVRGKLRCVRKPRPKRHRGH